MKAIGIIKRVDHLGRILLPKELRKALQIETNDPFEIFADGDSIVLKKYEKTCLFCGSNAEVISFKGKNICAACKAELEETAS